jgi:hypothetical protein
MSNEMSIEECVDRLKILVKAGHDPIQIEPAGTRALSRAASILAKSHPG